MNRKSRSKPLLIGLFAVGIAAASNAQANYFCEGPIQSAGMQPDGGVYAHSPVAGLSYVRLCSIATPESGITVDACKGILAVVLRAQATGATVQWAFNDSLTCTTHPDWSALTGWYRGPFIVSQ